MGLDREVWGVSWIVGVPWLGLLTLAYFVWKSRNGGGGAQPDLSPATPSGPLH
jgi:hypothetical protein